ncbi:Neuromedin-K receptor [Trichoplax sp. H2]|nr:Neuromedin-K receptor [Trichoplax sp. H2]|eukprot:RDD39655.1 Neuromedin-K receptor [Trichoplax sp. H2]
MANFNISAPSTNSNATASPLASVLTFTVSLLGVLGNFILLSVILTAKKLKDPSYTFITNVTVSDLLMALQVCFLFLPNNLTKHFFFYNGILACRLLYSVFYASYNASVFSLTMISIYRYKIVIKPLRYRLSPSSFKYTKIIIISIWIVSILNCIPTFLLTNYSVKYKVCDVSYPYGTAFNIFYYVSVFTVTYILPVLIMLVNYLKIGCKLSSQTSPLTHTFTDARQISMRSKAVIKFLVGVTAVYMLLSWPFVFGIMAMSIAKTTISQLIQDFSVAPQLLTYSFATSMLVSIINPILYLMFDKNIKSEIRRKIYKI